MSAKFYPNGAGGVIGDRFDTCKPLICSGNIWYVSSLIGTDAASPAGQNREKPLATIQQAITNAANDDIIVCLQGHTQTVTVAIGLSKRLMVIGEGTAGGKPGVQFNANAAAGSVIFMSTAGCELRNLYFPANAQANSSAKISVTTAFSRIVGCYFEQGATDTGTGIGVTADNLRIDSTTIISTATTTAAQPNSAIKATATSTVNMEFTDLVVSAGTVGFSNYSAIDLTLSTSLLQFKAIGLSLLLGADMDLPATWTGQINVQLATGGSRVLAP